MGNCSINRQVYNQKIISKQKCNVNVPIKYLQYSEENISESLFYKVVGLQLSCEYGKIFKNSFLHKTPPVAASSKFIDFLGKH